MFQPITPEAAGISSRRVLDFLKTLEEYRMHTHSVLMARGHSIFAETYFAPIDAQFEHRMYSVSKSFLSMAVGLAKTEGLLSLEDKILDHLPEYRNENTDACYEETTIRDMLSMQSNIASFTPWYGTSDDRVKSYYTMKTAKIPGTVYYYDSMGSYLLGCIVEKLTGMTFLDYLKDRVLLNLGFSKESSTLYAPGKYTIGDSGVLCTARDLLIFARFIMDKGCAGGKQYIDLDFMEAAVATQTDNDVSGGMATWNSYGYGFLIWKLPEDGFALVGMGDQLVLCDTKRDFIFLITSDNQGCEGASRALIYHLVLKDLLPALKDAPLPEDETAYQALQEYLTTRKLLTQWGSLESPFAKEVQDVTYTLSENPMGIDWFRLSLKGGEGSLTYQKNGKERTLPFLMGENHIGPFPDDKRNGLVAGELIDGTYTCATSAAWTEEKKLVIQSQIIDTYLGQLHIHLSFKDNRVTLMMQKSGQYILDGYEGYAIGKRKEIKS